MLIASSFAKMALLSRCSIAEDIDTYHSFMEMEAATRGVAHFNENRPEFEGTTEQKIGLFGKDFTRNQLRFFCFTEQLRT